MGEHKFNPISIKAKNGELPPKPKRKSKKQVEEELYREIFKLMDEKTGGIMSLIKSKSIYY